MKKAYKILLILGFILLVAVIASVVFRHQIASFALRTVINNRSEGKIVLTIDSTYFSLREGTVSLTGPDILFTDAYLDENHTVKLNRISLDEILIDSISILDVLFNRHIFAGQLIIKKPVIWFEEQKGVEKSSFDPDKLMQTLNQKPSDMSKLDISIRDIEIQYGTLNMAAEGNNKFAPGYVDFKLILHNFSTQLPTDTAIKKILFSDDFLFKIKNLQKSFPSGYELKIDSALFSSLLKSMIWNGVSISAIQKDSIKKHGIDLYAGSFTLNDIEIKQLNELSDLHLRSLIVSKGHLYKYGDRLIQQNKKDTLNDNGIRELFSILHGFELDTLWLDRFNFVRLVDEVDTVFRANDISMMINGIVLDSNMIDDPWKKLIVNEISFRTGRFYAKNLIDSIDIEFTDIAYYSTEQKFLLNGLKILDNNKIRGQNILKVSSGKIKIDDFSVFQLQKNLKQSISLTLLEPEIVINTKNKESQAGKKNNKLTELFGIERFVIKDGDFSFTNDSLSFQVNNLDFNAENFEFTGKGKIPLSYENMFLNLDKLVVDINSFDDIIRTGNILFQNNYLKINAIQTIIRTGEKKRKSSVTIDFIEMKDLELNKFLRKNELDIADLIIDGPVLKGSIQINKNNDSLANTANHALIPFKIDIDRLNIRNGKADCRIFTNHDSIDINSVINLEIASINGDENDTLNLWLEDLNWKLKLSASKVASGRMKANFKQLTLDEMNSIISLKEFKFYHEKKPGEKKQAFEISTLSVPKFEINGIDFDKFIFYDTLTFSKITIDKPFLDAIIFPGVKPEKKQIAIPDISFLEKVKYDSIELKNLNFKIENKGKDSSNAFYSLKDLNVAHLNSKVNKGNIFSGLVFSFDNFTFKDTITNIYVKVSAGNVNPVNQTVSIAEVQSGFIHDDNLASTNLKKDSYRLTNIQLSGIYLENKLPTQFTVEKLKVDSLELYFFGKEKTGGSTAIDINRNMLANYNVIISKLKIDTTLLNNLRVNYWESIHDEQSSVNFENVALILNDISLDTVKSAENSFPLNDVTVNLRGRTFITKDSLYDFRTGNINYNFASNKLRVDSLWFTPRLSDTLFFNKAVYQTDRMDIFAQQVELSDIRFQEYIKDKIIHVGSVDLHNIKAEMARDKSYPMKPGLFKDMPQASIRSASQIFTIDSVRVFDSYVQYSQRVEKSDVPGQIFFDRFNIQMYNLSNDPRFVDSSSQLVVNANAYIMGQSRLDLSAYFNLLSPVDAFWYKAKSEPIDLTCLNSMTENLMGMSISQGNGFIDISKIEGDSGVAQGQMYFKYKKLKITLYNRKKAQLHKGMFTPFVDFMLNDLLLKSNNPKFARSPRIGQAYFERDTQKAIVNYIFKTSLSGIISTLGFNNKEQRQERKELKDEEIPNGNHTE